ncbi:MAG: hypothetical protein KGP28_04030 [Bdellovibrionales bacterium]|nr:hypothetical protein [Bdellovibrionales bacterium]
MPRKVLLIFLVASMGCPGFAEESQPAVSPLLQPSPTMIPISREEKARIYSQFKKKLAEEEREFERQEKTRRRELVKSQNERRKEWREREKKARREFFESHTSGPERRHYVQDFVKRKKEFDATEKREWVEFKQRQSEERKAFRLSRQERNRRVNESLDKNIKPEI